MPTAKTVNEIKGILDRILKLLEPYVRTLELNMAGFFFFFKALYICRGQNHGSMG